jgi:hypothetical protein
MIGLLGRQAGKTVITTLNTLGSANVTLLRSGSFTAPLLPTDVTCLRRLVTIVATMGEKVRPGDGS